MKADYVVIACSTTGCTTYLCCAIAFPGDESSFEWNRVISRGRSRGNRTTVSQVGRVKTKKTEMRADIGARTRFSSTEPDPVDTQAKFTRELEEECRNLQWVQLYTEAFEQEYYFNNCRVYFLSRNVSALKFSLTPARKRETHLLSLSSYYQNISQGLKIVGFSILMYILRAY